MRHPSKTQPKIQAPEADKHKSLVKIPIELELKKKSGPAEDRAKVEECNGDLEEEDININAFQEDCGCPIFVDSILSAKKLSWSIKISRRDVFDVFAATLRDFILTSLITATISLK